MKSKLTLAHIHIIGVVSVLVLAAILFFALIKPKNEEIETRKGEVAALVAEGAGGTQDQVERKQRELKKTEEEAKLTQARWDVNQEKYMVNEQINFGTTETLPITYYDYIRTLPERFGRWVAAWYDAQRDRGISRMPGVEFPIAAFTPDPNVIPTITSLRFPQQGAWPVQLECKTFDAAMEHLTKFNNMRKHGMPVVDGVALQGHSPNLIMSYNLALYVIPKPKAPAPDPRISTTPPAAAGAGAAPGGMGMMGGGSMGSMMMGGGSMGMGGAPPPTAGRGGPAMSSVGAGASGDK
jgi:hypothetical protein